MKQDQINKLIDDYILLSEESKKQVIVRDLKIQSEANTILLGWLKGVDSRDISKEKKEALRKSLNKVFQFMKLANEYKYKNQELEERILLLESSSKLNEKMYLENRILKESIQNLMLEYEQLKSKL